MQGLSGSALVAAALVFIAAFGRPSCAQSPAPAPSTVTDADILNFALNLECLEAEFYSYAAFGTGLSATDRGSGPASLGGMKANLSSTALAYATEIADNEIAHVKFLRAALGSAAVACPLMDIGSAFSAAANAATNSTLSPVFSPYANDLFFYHGAFIFEDVGVTAYHGAAPLIQSKAYLAAAAGIEATEAYHGGVIRTLLYQARNTTTPYGIPVAGVVAAIAALRESVNPGAMDEQGIVNGTGAAVLVPVDMNAIVFSRTPTQVLNIVYLGSASKPGGFFPNGLNGNIK